ncbi:unnamed protein product [Pleuronectes platessa]|uniref:Uncharacterized protein n=1 Tax=Pleuronectes platessa TaxID=8262 RepID=A0A9N7UAW5_PLEPL|nr:unnamed protein product [Pleuronectes platessa]
MRVQCCDCWSGCEADVVGSVQTSDGSRDKPAPESQSADKDEEAGVGRVCGNVYCRRNSVSVLDVWRLRSQDTPGPLTSAEGDNVWKVTGFLSTQVSSVDRCDQRSRNPLQQTHISISVTKRLPEFKTLSF